MSLDLAKQRDQIRNLIENVKIKNGQIVHVICAKWFTIWKNYVDYHIKNEFISIIPGPIDNGQLISSFYGSFPRLKKLIKNEIDYVIIPEDAGKLLHSWYGGKDPIIRKVGPDGEVDLYPLLLHLSILTSHKQSDQEKSPIENGHIPLTKIFGTTIGIYCRHNTLLDMKNEFISTTTLPILSCRVWATLQGIPYRLFSEKEEGIPIGVLITRTYGQQLTIEVKLQGEDDFPLENTKLRQKQLQGQFKETSFKTTEGIVIESKQNVTSFVNNSPSIPGICGIQNLGNTCFMAAAVQCLCKMPTMQEYFLKTNWEEHLNIENTFGTKGKITKEFHNVMNQIHSGKHSYVIPTNLKQAISEKFKQFSGNSQQDSSEFVTCLLDALHEDLNGAAGLMSPSNSTTDLTNKSISIDHDHNVMNSLVDKQPTGDGSDDNKVARESWELHLRRNKSVIVDKFTGLLRSTVKCSECGNISVTFDTFTMLSLPLPLESQHLTVIYFTESNENPPRQFEIILPHGSIGKDLREAVAKRLGGRNPLDFIIAEVASTKILRLFVDETSFEGVSNDGSTSIHVYECKAGLEGHLMYKSTPSGFIPTRMVKIMQVFAGLQNVWGTEACGIPFMTKYTPETTVADLYKQVFQFIKRYLHKHILTDNPFHFKFDKPRTIFPHSDSELDEYLFLLVLMNQENVSEKLFYSEEVLGEKIHGFSANGCFDKEILVCLSPAVIQKLVDVEEFNKVTLDINGDQKEERFDEVPTLSSSMKLFQTQEMLGDEDTWHCNKCQKKVTTTKKLDIWQLPEVLIVHLNRFQFNASRRGKLTTFISCPLKDLDLTSFVNGPTKENKSRYDVFAVINHTGFLNQGHYTAVAKMDNGNWYLFDDSRTQEIKEADVITSNAYVFFLHRK